MFPFNFSRIFAAGAILAAATLTAQAPVIPVTPDTAPLVPPPVAPAAQKSVGEAVAISLASTYVPAFLAFETKNGGAKFASGLGLLIGPSTGYWYAGSPQWKSGLITRGIATGVGTGGLLLMVSQCFWSDSNSGTCGIGEGLLLASAAVIVVSDIVDIARLPAAVRATREPAFTVSPAIGPGARSAGLSMQLRF